MPSKPRRLWLALGGAVIVAAGAVTGIVAFGFPSHAGPAHRGPAHYGPAHTLVTPARIGTYVRTLDQRQAELVSFRKVATEMNLGQVSNVVSAVYVSGNSAAGATGPIVLFAGGHLANADPAASVAGFMQKFAGAHPVDAGSLGGKAGCVQEGAGTVSAVALCVWFDNDSFGELVSPTMNAVALANVMLTFRPSVELPVTAG